MASRSFGLELIDLIGRHYPGAFSGKVEHHAKACAEMSTALGGLLAIIRQQQGEAAWRACVAAIARKMSDDQLAIEGHAKASRANTHFSGAVQ